MPELEWRATAVADLLAIVGYFSDDNPDRTLPGPWWPSLEAEARPAGEAPESRIVQAAPCGVGRATASEHGCEPPRTGCAVFDSRKHRRTDERFVRITGSVVT